jgi:hypothetical protein
LNVEEVGDSVDGVTFPLGLLSFNVRCLGEVGVQKVSIYLPKGVSVSGVMNYGPTSDNTDLHFYPFFLNDGEGAVVGSRTITLYVKDGGWGDNDQIVNGKISLLCGPTNPLASPATRAPSEVLYPGDEMDKASSVDEWVNYK